MQHSTKVHKVTTRKQRRDCSNQYFAEKEGNTVAKDEYTEYQQKESQRKRRNRRTKGQKIAQFNANK